MGVPRLPTGRGVSVRRFHHAPLGCPGDLLHLGPEVAHHVTRVLRRKAGEAVVLFDGAGLEAPGELVIEADRVSVRQSGPSVPAGPAFAIHLLLGVLKGPTMDDAIRMATEAGASVIHPLITARTIAMGDRQDRWERIATEAARQCGRADVPIVNAPAKLSTGLARCASLPVRRVALPGAASLPGAEADAAILIGPEGGLSRDEVESALALGFQPAGLGPWTLRAVTAAAVAVASLHAPI